MECPCSGHHFDSSSEHSGITTEQWQHLCMKTCWHKLNNEQMQHFPPPPFFFPSPSHMDSNSIWNIQAHLQKLLASAAYCMDSSVLLWGGAQRDMPCVVMVEVLFLTFVHDVPDRRSYSLKNAFCARLLHSGTGLLSTIYLKEPWNKLTRGRQRLQCCSTNVRELGCADAAYLWTWPVLGEEHCMQHCLQGCWITSMLRYPPPPLFSFFFCLRVMFQVFFKLVLPQVSMCVAHCL